MNSWNEFFKALGSILSVALVVFATYLTSWAMTTSLIWLISKLFRLNFELRIATSIWLVLVLIEKFIKGVNAKK